jgi:MFS transporter, FHS family, glucose/mannose:H+ symporter
MTDTLAQAARTVSRRSVWLLTAGAFYAFFVFGFVDNLKGPVLPVLLRDLHFSYSLGGTLLLAAYIGFLTATLVTGVLADRLGTGIVLLLAGICLTVGLVLFARSSAFWVLAAALTTVGLGMGAIEVGANSLIVELHSAARGRFLNLLAVFHGIGALSVPLYAAALLQNGFSWRQVYQFAAALTVGIIVFFLLARTPPRANRVADGPGLAVLRQTGFTRQMALYYTVIGTYVAAELGIAAWIVEFLNQTKGISLALGSLYLSLFFAFVMIGRLAGSLLVERVGYLRIMLLAAGASIACLAAGIYGPPSLAILVPLTGLFFSIIFPTTTAAVSRLHLHNTGAILGLLFAFGGLGGALGPWAMGIASDWLGVQQGFALTIIYCLVMATALLVLRRMEHEAGRA